MDQRGPGSVEEKAVDDESDSGAADAVSAPNSVSQTNPRGAGTKRKRGPAAVASSRSVASLTPEQLEKKRRNDREAQRAIRERTKSQIDTLNDKIRAYEQSQPYVELTLAQRQREQIQEENEELKRKMAQVMGLLSPHVSGTWSTQSTSRHPQQHGRERQMSVSHRLPPMQMHNSDFIEPAAIPAIRSPVAYMPSPSSQENYATSTYQSAGPVRSWPSPALTAEHSRPNDEERETPYTPGDEKLERGYTLNNTNSNFVRVPYTVSPEQRAPAPYTPPIYQMLPRSVHDCPLDGVLLRFLHETQVCHAKGVALTELEGPPQPSFNILLNPSTRWRPHELSKMLLGIMNTLPDLSKLPEQIAVLHMMYLVMRWQIRPTKENYDAIPDWLQPRPAQVFVTHPHWLDYIPWPRLRDACVQTVPYVSFQDFFVPYTKTYSINWPHAPELCLVPAPAGYPYSYRSAFSSAASPAASSHHGTPSAISPFAPPHLPLQQHQHQNQHQHAAHTQLRHSRSPLASTHHSPSHSSAAPHHRASTASPQQRQQQHHHHQHHQSTTGTTAPQHPSSSSAAAPPPAAAADEEAQLILSPAFEAHIMQLDNWSLGSMFRDTFPQWAGLWTLRDRPLAYAAAAAAAPLPPAALAPRPPPPPSSEAARHIVSH